MEFPVHEPNDGRAGKPLSTLGSVVFIEIIALVP